MYAVLAIDSGNSFLKWGYFKNDQWLICKTVHNQDLSSISLDWEHLEQPNSVIVSHVSDNGIHDQLCDLLKIWSTKPYWITALPEQCGVTNNYSDPYQLGSDRWAALIASWNKFRESCLVVDIGTGMTVDVLSPEGIFLGGIIVPGPHVLMHGIQSNTQVKLTGECHQYEVLPVNTANALYSGIIQSLTGAIERMMRLYNLQHSCAIKHCIVTGGGTAELLPYMDFDYVVVDNLVLEGLVLIAQDVQQNDYSVK